MRKFILATIILVLGTAPVYAKFVKIGFSNLDSIEPGDDVSVCNTRYDEG